MTDPDDPAQHAADRIREAYDALRATGSHRRPMVTACAGGIDRSRGRPNDRALDAD